MVATVVTFFIFTLSFPGWYIPNDVWSAWQGAQFVDHGWYASMYRVMPTIAEFPLWPILMAPFRALSDVLGLRAGFVWIGVEISPARAGAWLLYGSLCAIAGGVMVFAGDALAAALDATKGRRMLLTAGLAALSFYIGIYWGHPEDLLATGLLVYGLLALRDGKVRQAGWLTGIALACNPLVILAVPVLLARLTRATWARFVVRMAAVPVVLLIPAFLANFKATWGALGEEQNSLLDHQTILVSLGRHVGHNIVYAGPIRSVMVLLVAVAAFALARRSTDLSWAVLIAGLALLARQLGEVIMNPYYLAPGIAVLGVLLLAKRPTAQAITGVAASVVALILAGITLARWEYSLLVLLGSVAIGVAAWPFEPDASARDRTRPPVERSAPPAGRLALPRVVAACVVTVVAVVGLTAYARSSSAAQFKVMATNWKAGPGKLGNLPYGLPIPKNLTDRIYHVQGTTVFSDPTLNSNPLWAVPTSTARMVRSAASAAERVAEKWRTLAWIAPSKVLSSRGTGTPHTVASKWVSELAAKNAPDRATWLRGPNYCYQTAHTFNQSQLGTPDYRLMLWFGCGDKTTWLDTHPGIALRAVRTDVVVGPPAHRIYMVTNPSSTRVLDVYIGWTVHAGMHVATPKKPFTYELSLRGQMVLQPSPSGYKIVDPWREYGFSGHNVFG